MGKKLPKNWVVSSIGSSLDVSMGQSPPSTSYNTEMRGVPFMQGKTEFGDTFPTIRKYTTEPKKIVRPNTVLLSVRAPIGPTNISNIELCIGRGLAGISSEIIPVNYLLYYFRSIEDILAAKGTGTTFTAISKERLLETDFPLPPLPEQQRIVAKLDALFAQQEKMKSSLAKIPQILKDFRQAVLTQAVTGKLTEEWRKGKELEDVNKVQLEKKRIAEINYGNDDLVKNGKRKQKVTGFASFGNNKYGWLYVDVQSATTFIVDCLHNTPKFEVEGHFVVDTTCIKPFKIDWDKARRVNNDYFDKWIERLKPSYGDVLFSREGTIGVAVKVPEEIDLCIGQRMMLFRMSPDVLPEFAEIYFNSMVFRDEYLPHVKGVAAQHLNIGSIRQLNFPIPTLKEQTEIVSRVEALFSKADKIEAQYKKLKEKIAHLPQAILAKAFKGELVEQLESDGDARELLKEIDGLKGKK